MERICRNCWWYYADSEENCCMLGHDYTKYAVDCEDYDETDPDEYAEIDIEQEG